MPANSSTVPRPLLPRTFSFQQRVHEWVVACFGEIGAADYSERNYRLLEEALELVQACGCSREDALKLVEYVYSRPLGDPQQEVGGVAVTLAALCNAQDLSLEGSAEAELARVWTKIPGIRAKQATKPVRSPLPGLTVVSANGPARVWPTAQRPQWARLGANAWETRVLGWRCVIAPCPEGWDASVATVDAADWQRVALSPTVADAMHRADEWFALQSLLWVGARLETSPTPAPIASSPPASRSRWRHAIMAVIARSKTRLQRRLPGAAP